MLGPVSAAFHTLPLTVCSKISKEVIFTVGLAGLKASDVSVDTFKSRSYFILGKISIVMLTFFMMIETPALKEIGLCHYQDKPIFRSIRHKSFSLTNNTYSSGYC